MQPHPTSYRLRTRRQGLHDQNLPRTRRDRGTLLWIIRHVSEVRNLLERRKRNPCSKRPNRELRMPSQLWSVFKPPQPHWISEYHSYQPICPHLLPPPLPRHDPPPRPFPSPTPHAP